MKKIYSMIDVEDYIDEARLYIEDYVDDEDEKESLEHDLYDLASQFCYTDWTDYYSEILKKYFSKHVCLALGSIGRWDGTYRGGSVIESYSDFEDLLEDCVYVELYDDNGYLQVIGTHHDGKVQFTVKELNDNGIDWYRDYAWDADDRKVLRMLNSNFCSRKPNIEWYL